MPRVENRLNYETIEKIIPAPYNHLEVYNKALAEVIERLGKKGSELKDLSKDEKVRVTAEAQTTVIKHIESLQTPEAEEWKRLVAGMFADLIEHYIEQTRYLKNGSKVLYPTGTHGGTMEWLLQQTLIRGEGDAKQVGLQSLDEIGGAFDSSDSYDVFIQTNAQGQLQNIAVTFDNPERPREMLYLDANKLHELARFYREKAGKA